MRWIDAPDHMKAKLYTIPAARKALAMNEMELCRAPIAAEVRRLRALHAISECDRERTRINRRIRSQLDEWRRVCEAHRSNVRLVTTGRA